MKPNKSLRPRALRGRDVRANGRGARSPALPAHAVRLHCGADDAGFHLQETRRAEASGRRRAEHPHHPDGRRGTGHALDLRRRDQHADARSRGEDGHLLQSLSLHGHVLAHACSHCSPGAITRVSATARSRRSPTTSTDSAGPSRSRRRRSPKCSRTTATTPGPGASGTTRPKSRSRPRGRSTIGRPATASSTSTASSPARPRSMNRPWCATPPRSPNENRKGYHLTEDIAEDAIKWLREQKAYAPDKPFFMYWAPGASHGPHQVMKEWADKYKGKFDDGWDKYRERVFARRQGQGLDSAERATHAAPCLYGLLGLDPRGRETVPAPTHGGLRRLHRARRLQRGTGHRRDRAAGQTGQHADLLHLGRQRILLRGPERHHQRAAWRRTEFRPRFRSTSRH